MAVTLACLVGWSGAPAFAESEPAQLLTIVAPEIPGTSEPGPRGRDVETVAAVFKECGWAGDFMYLPSGRHLLAFDDLPAADGVMTVPIGSQVEGFPTSPYIRYLNGAFYNASRVGPIDQVEDLKGLRAVTFRNGIRNLGLAGRAHEFELLMEISNQELHSKMQLVGRIDVILADGFVIGAVAERIRSERRSGKTWPLEGDSFVFSPIFEPTPYKMVFRKPGLAMQFDQCLGRVKARGELQEIDKKHIDRYRGLLQYRAEGGPERDPD
ncbi:amino acid ABC transporter substrate-binding protein [Marinobacter sp. VGCF2001]|uniref:amino acid ABC transporter substrate-binding protein n=1 Tax=Marinobacter sp. VGCF2001 TaxID=3417189 RepID=UPI003CE98F24